MGSRGVEVRVQVPGFGGFSVLGLRAEDLGAGRPSLWVGM